MRYVLLLAMFLIVQGSLAAQDLSLTGKVVDKSTNTPLPGVSVFIPEINRGVVTDLDGQFKITGIP